MNFVQRFRLEEGLVGLLEEQGIVFQIGGTLANDYPLCLAFLQGFNLDTSRVWIREH